MGRTKGTRIPVGIIPLLLVIIPVLALPSPLSAWNRSEIEWRTIETEHFEIHYHPGEEWVARQTAEIAEEIYGPITDFYGFKPGDKIHFNLFDKEDEIAGATYYYLNRIDISASGFDFHLRGTANWLRNVITHEFTHMVSIQKSMKMPRRIPAVYLQAIGFEEEKRPDVMTGYPNLQISVPLAGEMTPNWFAEGIAQYQYEDVRNDIWDSHRDMLLRTAVLNDNLLTMDEMGVFGKNSLQSEMVYNQGYSLVIFISERYGHEKLVELTAALSAPHRLTFNGACKKVLGLSEQKLYRMWEEVLRERYDAVTDRVREARREGERIAGKGFYNLFPMHDASGGLLYVSNDGADYSDKSLLHKGGDGKVKGIADDINSRFDISRDGKRICYAKRTDKNRYGYSIDDIFIFDLDGRKERRLTKGLRASSPAWSTDGRFIACVVRTGGMERIAIVDAQSGSTRYLTDHKPDWQHYGMSWGENGILVSSFTGTSRDIILVDTESGRERAILSSNADERDPCWDQTGAGFFYSSDRNGIFNVYYHALDGSIDLMVTNSIGGCYQPSVDGESCVFASYGSEGYEIRELSQWRAGAIAVDPIQNDIDLMEQRHRYIGLTPREGSLENKPQPGETNGTAAPNAEEGLYGINYSMLYIFPRLMIYDNKFRIGLFLDSGDLLGRQNVSAGGSVNFDKEFDLFIAFETRQFKPAFSANIFRIREYETFFILDRGSELELYTRYDLWDSYFACTLEFDEPSLFKRKEAAFQYNHGEYGLNFEIWEHIDQRREFKGAVGWNYYKSNEFSLFYRYRKVREEVEGDINPRSGRSVDLEVTRAFNQLHSGDFEYAFMPVYDENYFGRYKLKYEEYIPLPYWRHSLTLRVIGGILDNVVDDFFYLYLGSRDGLRGYTYFSLGGRRNVLFSATYRFPFMRNINWQLWSFYFQSLYLGVFAEAGNAWDEDEFVTEGYKRDVGFEVRLKGFSFYSYPLAASFEAAYGLDDLVYTDPFDLEMTLYEGKHWRYYGSILFNF